jgi:tRNA threonylcarbamoyladenosine biosynthesis protein TsaE
MSNDITLHLEGEVATLACGAQFSRCLQAGLVVFLHGDLGAGKTTFVRGVLQGFGYVGKVKSPTYNLVEVYKIKLNPVSSYNIYHFDLYRFNSEEEWEAAGFRDYFNAQNICMIEWPEKAAHVLPQADINLHLSILNETRNIQMSANTQLGRQCLEKL